MGVLGMREGGWGGGMDRMLLIISFGVCSLGFRGVSSSVRCFRIGVLALVFIWCFEFRAWGYEFGIRAQLMLYSPGKTISLYGSGVGRRERLVTPHPVGTYAGRGLVQTFD